MTFAEAETKVHALALKENIYFLTACNFEQQADNLREEACKYRKLAEEFHKEQCRVWDSLAKDSMSDLGLSLEEAD